jgi:hypothetical protein
VENFKIVIASAPTHLPAPKSTNLGKFKYITVKSRSKEQYQRINKSKRTVLNPININPRVKSGDQAQAGNIEKLIVV